MPFKFGDVCLVSSPVPLNDGQRVVVARVRETRDQPTQYLIRRAGGERFPLGKTASGQHVWYAANEMWVDERELVHDTGDSTGVVMPPTHPQEWLKALAK